MKLKLYISVIILFSISTLNGQTKLIKDELVESILKSKVYTVYNEPAICVNLDSSFLEYHLASLKKDTIKTEFTNGHNGNSIILTPEEKRYILNSFQLQKNFRWDKSQFPNNEKIEFEQIKDYLGKDYNNSIVVISEPIYIRKKPLAIVFSSNLCCGRGIGGFVELSIYKKDNHKWNKHIELSGGDF